jgi:hypothetical protein
MPAAGSDTSRGELSVLHVPLSDGSCRLIPSADLTNAERCLLWARVHGRFKLASDPPKIVYEDGPGLLMHEEWRGKVRVSLEPELTVVFGSQRRQALNCLARLLYDCPPLVFLEPVQRALANALAEREKDFFASLHSRATKYQHGTRKRDSTGRLRPPFIADWEKVERWRLHHERRGLTATCKEIAAETHGEGSQRARREARRLERGYQRAMSHNSIKAIVVAAIGCPLNDGRLHYSPPPPVVPRLEVPRDLGKAKTLAHLVHVFPAGVAP